MVKNVNENIVEQIINEYNKLNRLDHKNIIKLYRYGKSNIKKKNIFINDIFYLKMQLISGGTLDDFVDLFGGQLTEDEAKFIFL